MDNVILTIGQMKQGHFDVPSRRYFPELKGLRVGYIRRFVVWYPDFFLTVLSAPVCPIPGSIPLISILPPVLFGLVSKQPIKGRNIRK